MWFDLFDGATTNADWNRIVSFFIFKNFLKNLYLFFFEKIERMKIIC